LAERIARTKALLVVARQTIAAAPNQRHTAILRRAVRQLLCGLGENKTDSASRIQRGWMHCGASNAGRT
jgi:hypothetical protein